MEKKKFDSVGRRHFCHDAGDPDAHALGESDDVSASLKSMTIGRRYPPLAGVTSCATSSAASSVAAAFSAFTQRLHRLSPRLKHQPCRFTKEKSAEVRRRPGQGRRCRGKSAERYEQAGTGQPSGPAPPTTLLNARKPLSRPCAPAEGIETPQFAESQQRTLSGVQPHWYSRGLHRTHSLIKDWKSQRLSRACCPLTRPIIHPLAIQRINRASREGSLLVDS